MIRGVGVPFDDKAFGCWSWFEDASFQLSGVVPKIGL